MREVRIPKLGLDAIECEIRGWFVKVGDVVTAGTPLLEVESEKVVVSIEADMTGALCEIRARPGQIVPVGSVVCLIDEEAASTLS